MKIINITFPSPKPPLTSVAAETFSWGAVKKIKNKKSELWTKVLFPFRGSHDLSVDIKDVYYPNKYILSVFLGQYCWTAVQFLLPFKTERRRNKKWKSVEVHIKNIWMDWLTPQLPSNNKSAFQQDFKEIVCDFYWELNMKIDTTFMFVGQLKLQPVVS